jgi:CRP/FNR family transcriptional regulator, cyclic AMP receptor protein
VRIRGVGKRHGDPKVDRLAQLQLFSGCGRSELERIAALTVEVEVPAGKVLMREGEPGREFFVIEEGTATAHVAGGKTKAMGPGDCFGEIALLREAPRSATVEADTDMRVVVLHGREFASLMDEVPSVARGVLAAVADRLQEAETPQPHH